MENGVLQETGSASGVRVREFPLSYAVSLLPSKQLQAAQKIFISYVPSIKDETATIETNCRHALEKSERILDQVQVLEAKHGIRKRWTPEAAEWIQASAMTASSRYQKALD